jgi:hypothetical protein
MAGEAQYAAPRSQIISFWFKLAKQTARKVIYMDCRRNITVYGRGGKEDKKENISQ